MKSEDPTTNATMIERTVTVLKFFRNFYDSFRYSTTIALSYGIHYHLGYVAIVSADPPCAHAEAIQYALNVVLSITLKNHDSVDSSISPLVEE